VDSELRLGRVRPLLLRAGGAGRRCLRGPERAGRSSGPGSSATSGAGARSNGRIGVSPPTR
jgi:hypothetical protein